MDRITVTRPVIVKVRVTENYKEVLLRRLAAAIEEAEREVQRLEFQAKRLSTDKKARLSQVEADEMEKVRREKAENKERLRQQFETVKTLPPGAEIIQGRAESLAEIGIGDDITRLGPLEIIVEDGKVVAIREQG
ncbi:MAG: YlqD family protein [Bacillota bacterium]